MKKYRLLGCVQRRSNVSVLPLYAQNLKNEVKITVCTTNYGGVCNKNALQTFLTEILARDSNSTYSITYTCIIIGTTYIYFWMTRHIKNSSQIQTTQFSFRCITILSK